MNLKAFLLLATGLLAGGLAGPLQAQIQTDRFEVAAQALPAPPAADSRPPLCLRIGEARAPRLRYESPEVEARMSDVPQYRGLHATLDRWARIHAPTAARCWPDHEYIVSRLQAALGHPVSGVLAAADVARLEAALGQGLAQEGAERRAIGQARAAAQAEVAEVLAGAPRVFGLPLGVPLELPPCPNLKPGDYPPAMCQRGQGEERSVLFPRDEWPGWVHSVRAKMHDGMLAQLEVRPNNWQAAQLAISERFGSPTVERERYTNAFGVDVGSITITSWPAQGMSIRSACSIGGSCRHDVIVFAAQRLANSQQRRQREQQIEDQAQKGRKL